MCSSDLLVHTYEIIKTKRKIANGWRYSWGFGEILGIYIKKPRLREILQIGAKLSSEVLETKAKRKV